jgi:hypothetical protein
MKVRNGQAAFWIFFMSSIVGELSINLRHGISKKSKRKSFLLEIRLGRKIVHYWKMKKAKIFLTMEMHALRLVTMKKIAQPKRQS